MRQNDMILNTAMSEYLFVSAHANNAASWARVTLQCHVDYSHTWNAVSQTPSVQCPVCIPAPGNLATWGQTQTTCHRGCVYLVRRVSDSFLNTGKFNRKRSYPPAAKHPTVMCESALLVDSKSAKALVE